MTDRELLELAAKAAGLVLLQVPNTTQTDADWWAYEAKAKPNTAKPWNPLEDDAAALRLAVGLGIDVTHKAFGEDEVMVSASDDQFDGWFTEPYGDDKAAATRRAIVRAAAEIGKTMP